MRGERDALSRSRLGTRFEVRRQVRISDVALGRTMHHYVTYKPASVEQFRGRYHGPLAGKHMRGLIIDESWGASGFRTREG